MTQKHTTQRIGILGGTFNPVHCGHLMLARDAMEAHALNEVSFVPCARPAHKSAENLAPEQHRLALLETAVADNPSFTVSRVELDRAGTSYAIDTVHALRQERPDAEWYFIIGADTLPELPFWRSIEDLLPLCRFITMHRPGWPDGDALKARLPLPSPWPERLCRDVFEGHQVDISSSEIRKRVAEGRAIRYLVPAACETYIWTNELFVTEDERSNR